MGRVMSPALGDREVGQSVRVADIDPQPDRAFLLAAWAKIGAELHDLSVQLFDFSHPFDESQNGQGTTVECLPEYESNEIVSSILVVAPPLNAGASAPNTVTLQLGGRVMPLTMPATGYIHLEGMGMRLDRNDRRILTSVNPGYLLLELSGHADVRG
jgi:hypothetical protein